MDLSKRGVLKFGCAVCLFLLTMADSLYAAQRDSTGGNMTHMIRADFRPSYVFPSSRFLRRNNLSNDRIDCSLAAHVKYGFKFGPNTYWGKVYPYAVQGIGVAYNTFFNSSELGNPMAVYAFQTSRIVDIAPKLSLDYEWNFGVSFGWKEFNEKTNPYNRVIGSDVDAFINLNFLLNWQWHPRTYLHVGVGFSHYSNGSTHFPNFGVNTLGGMVGITQYFGKDKEAWNARALLPAFKQHVTYDLVLYGAFRKKRIHPADGGKKVLVPGNFAVFGLNFNPLYNFNRYFRAGVSLDVQYDKSANIGNHVANEVFPSNPDDLRFHKVPFSEQLSVGLSLRGELVMPIFSINFGIGKNLICKGADNNFVYQVLALKTNITKNLFLHTGYQLYHFKDPNNLMLGIGYRFNAKGKI